MASVKQYVQGVVNAIGEVNTSLTQINAQDVPNKIRELKVQVGSKQLLGTYDGSSVEVTEAGVVDIGAMLDEGKLPLEVNVNVQSGGEDTQMLIDLIEGDTTEIVIPEGTTKIGKSAFYQQAQLISVTIPNSVVDIYDNAFGYCSSLTNISLPDNMTSIGKYAFSACTKLKITRIPNGIPTISERMFDSCQNIKQELTIPDSVTRVDDYAFASCTGLPSIVIPDSVTKIGNYVFQNCVKLESITIGSGITSFGTNVFRYCDELTNFTMTDIRVKLQIGSGTSWGHLLTLDSLINTCKELINVGSARTLTIGTANLNKIASTYVKFTDSTQTEIAVDTKGEVEVCESTDEGAMLLSDYALLKNWTLA